MMNIRRRVRILVELITILTAIGVGTGIVTPIAVYIWQLLNGRIRYIITSAHEDINWDDDLLHGLKLRYTFEIIKKGKETSHLYKADFHIPDDIYTTLHELYPDFQQDIELKVIDISDSPKFKEIPADGFLLEDNKRYVIGFDQIVIEPSSEKLSGKPRERMELLNKVANFLDKAKDKCEVRIIADDDDNYRIFTLKKIRLITSDRVQQLINKLGGEDDRPA